MTIMATVLTGNAFGQPAQTKKAGNAGATEEVSAALDEITKVVGKVNSIVANVSSEMTKFRV